MAIFGKKKSKKKREFLPPIEVEKIDTSKLAPQVPSHTISQELDRVDDKSENLAPVFVKISKYKDILNSVNYLKMGFNVIKNQIEILSRIESIQRENMKLLYSVLEKVNNQLAKLDSEFTRPVDFMKEVSDMKVQDIEGLESTINDLKSQIDQLKSEVETMV